MASTSSGSRSGSRNASSSDCSNYGEIPRRRGERDPERYPPDPGLERSGASIRLAPAKRLREGVLHHISRLLATPGNGCDHIAKGDVPAPVELLDLSLACSHYSFRG